jgi:hypothetical protein
MRLLILLFALPLMGCPASLCDATEGASITLGDGVGGAFLAYDTEQEVPLRSAPQGGFGVTVLISTSGLPAGDGMLADVQLDVSQGGEEKGSFLSANAPLQCRAEDEGGLIEGLVVGFDGDLFPTLDDFIDINGTVVDLEVTVTTHEGPSAETSHPVTVNLSR